MSWNAIVMAAGMGTRMKSKVPKVLHKVAGTSMIERIVRQLLDSGCSKIHIVISEGIKSDLEPLAKSYKQIKLHIQKSPKGTADAVMSVPENELSENLFICNGDHPLVNLKDIQFLMSEQDKKKADLLVATLVLKTPGSFGRIVRKNDEIEKIVEAKEASPEQLKIGEINTGLYFGKTKSIFKALKKLQNIERKTEFYLTDIVQEIKNQGGKVTTAFTTKAMAFGVNDSESLYLANRKAYKANALKFLKSGVKFLDIKSVYIDDEVEIGEDTFIYPNVYLKGKTNVAANCTLESGVHIHSSEIGPDTYIKAGSYLESIKAHGESSIGPFARLREGTEVEKHVKIGNFVETKKTLLKEGVKAGHQCYLGDSEIGEGTNIGAGTITCNFAADGKKYKTKIGKNVFVGSDSQIVPPVTIHDNAVVAAGATVTKDVEANSLYVTRAKALVKNNYRK